MGFSTIGASVIIFAGLLFVTSVTANVLFEAQRSYGDAMDQERARDDLRRLTSISLHSAGQNSGNTFHFNATNDGDSVLDIRHIALIIDGDWSNDRITSQTIDGRITDLWAAGQTLRIEATQATEPQRAYLVVETGQGVLWTP